MDTVLRRYISFIAVVAASSVEAQTENGDPFILKRGFSYIGRIVASETSEKVTGSRYKEYYVKIIEPRKSFEMLSVAMPTPRIGSQLLLGKYVVDCENGATRWVFSQLFDATWSPESEQLEMKGAKWELPVAHSVLYASRTATCASR